MINSIQFPAIIPQRGTLCTQDGHLGRNGIYEEGSVSPPTEMLRYVRGSADSFGMPTARLTEEPKREQGKQGSPGK